MNLETVSHSAGPRCLGAASLAFVFALLPSPMLAANRTLLDWSKTTGSGDVVMRGSARVEDNLYRDLAGTTHYYLKGEANADLRIFGPSFRLATASIELNHHTTGTTYAGNATYQARVGTTAIIPPTTQTWGGATTAPVTSVPIYTQVSTYGAFGSRSWVPVGGVAFTFGSFVTLQVGHSLHLNLTTIDTMGNGFASDTSLDWNGFVMAVGGGSVAVSTGWPPPGSTFGIYGGLMAGRASLKASAILRNDSRSESAGPNDWVETKVVLGEQGPIGDVRAWLQVPVFSGWGVILYYQQYFSVWGGNNPLNETVLHHDRWYL